MTIGSPAPATELALLMIINPFLVTPMKITKETDVQPS